MAKVNYIIDQGRTFTTQVLLNDQNGNSLDVTSYKANGAMRKHTDSKVYTLLNCSLSNGVMTVSLSANQTSQLTDGRYVYDVALTDPSNNIVNLIEGLITVKPASYHWWSDANAATYSSNAANNSW